MKVLIYLSVILLGVASCRSANEDTANGNILLSATVESTSAASASVKVDASSTTFTDGDQLGIYFVEQGLNLSPLGNQTDNHRFSYNGTSWSGSLLTNPFTGSKIIAYGYYPYDANQTDATRINYTPQADQSAGITADRYFLRGLTSNGTPITPSTDGANPTKVELTFTNCLTKLTADVALSWAATEPEITVTNVYALNQPSYAHFNLQSNTWTIPEQTKEIKMHKNADGKYECLTIPNTYSASTPLFRIEHTNGQFLYYADKSGGLVLAPNSIHTFTVSNPGLYCLTEFDFPQSGSMIKANIVTNMTESWTLSVKEGASWLSVANADEVTATANNTNLSRFGLLELSNGVYNYEVFVLQR